LQLTNPQIGPHNSKYQFLLPTRLREPQMGRVLLPFEPSRRPANRSQTVRLDCGLSTQQKESDESTPRNRDADDRGRRDQAVWRFACQLLCGASRKGYSTR